jgi:hypothetical protein
LAAAHGHRVAMVCSHDATELRRLQKRYSR